MGVENLKENLELFNILKNANIEKEIIKNKIKKNNTKNFLIADVFIDFSILLHKYIYVVNSMENLLMFFKNYFNYLNKNKYTYFIFLDPENNIRKSYIHKKRHLIKQQILEKYKKTINDDLNCLQSLFDVNAEINKEKYNLLNLNNYALKKDYIAENLEDYKNKLKILDQNIVKSKILDNIEKNGIKYNSDDDTDEDTTKIVIINDKLLFSIFILNNSFVLHTKYIIEKLKSENIIKDDNLIYSDTMDAEAYMIKKSKNYNNDILFVSNDQDVLLLSQNIKNKKHIYISSNNFELNNIKKLKLKTILGKNISFLTIFFNTSDYFPGIKNFVFNKKKIEKFSLSNILKYSFKNSKCLLSSVLYKIYGNTTKIFENEEIIKQKIDNRIKDIIAYINLKKNFYLQNNNKIEKIDVEELKVLLKNNEVVIYENDKYTTINI